MLPDASMQDHRHPLLCDHTSEDKGPQGYQGMLLPICRTACPLVFLSRVSRLEVSEQKMPGSFRKRGGLADMGKSFNNHVRGRSELTIRAIMKEPSLASPRSAQGSGEKIKSPLQERAFFFLAPGAGLEPATWWLTATRSTD